MTDVLVSYINKRFDITQTFGDFQSDPGLETAVLISLFTDRRVAPEELPPGETDRRGWYGDEISDFNADLIGSKLWLLERMGATQVSRSKAEEYAREALQWIIDDGIAERLDVSAFLVNREGIELRINIDRPNVKNKSYYRFQLVWEGQLMQVRKAD